MAKRNRKARNTYLKLYLPKVWVEALHLVVTKSPPDVREAPLELWGTIYEFPDPFDFDMAIFYSLLNDILTQSIYHKTENISSLMGSEYLRVY